MLRFKHSTYHGRFLRFIASTSGLKAPHLTRSITLCHASALLLSFLSVRLTLLHFLHLLAPRFLSGVLRRDAAPPPPSFAVLLC